MAPAIAHLDRNGDARIDGADLAGALQFGGLAIANTLANWKRAWRLGELHHTGGGCDFTFDFDDAHVATIEPSPWPGFTRHTTTITGKTGVSTRVHFDVEGD